MMRMRHAILLCLFLPALTFLVSCGTVQEGPQGITGVWQVTSTGDSSGATSLENLWIEPTSGDNVVVRNIASSLFLDGSFSANQLVFRYLSVGPSTCTIQATKDGNRLENGTTTCRLNSNNSLLFSGTFEGDFVMHPADLNTSFNSGGPGFFDY